jgi:hypothetical protein
MMEPFQVRLAVSLHCATDEERSALLPANKRYGGLDELMTTLNEYITVTGRRITFEWALIDGKNDSIETARTLGRLIAKYQLRRDMVHINVIPLNPTGGYAGSPSQRHRVNDFCNTLEKEFNIACTPRVRRGIDIDAGCGQLKSKLKDESPAVIVENDLTEGDDNNLNLAIVDSQSTPTDTNTIVIPIAHHAAVDIDESDDYDDPEMVDDWEKEEADRLINLVKGSVVKLP